jgi:peptide/nickel transport system substrate-binding protein
MMIFFGNKLVDPELWNPFVPGYSQSYLYGAGLIWGPYEHLVYTNYQTGQVVPFLAEDMSYNDDLTELTVTLRDGIKWSDGVAFTADDVVFTFNMMLDQAPALTYSSDIAANVESVTKVDDLTVKFTLLTSNPRYHLIHWAFSNPKIVWSPPIVPKHIWEDVADPVAFKNYPPVGTGPYDLVEVSETRVLWQRRDDWWGWDVFHVRPGPKYVEALYTAGIDTTIFMFGKDQVDAGSIATQYLFTIQEENPFIRTWSEDPPYRGIGGICPRYLMFNNLVYPWSLPEVRWAVSLALNRTLIIEAAMGGQYAQAEPAVIIPGIMAPEYRTALNELIADTGLDASEYNPAKAEQKLLDIGAAKGGDGVWVTANGTRLSVEIISYLDVDEELTVVTQMLNDIGIEATWRTMEYPTYVTTVTTGNYAIARRHMCASAIDPFFSLDNMHGRHFRPIGETTGWHINIERFNNATFDAVMDEWRATSPDDPQSLELFKEAMTIYLQQLPATTHYDEPEGLLYNTRWWTNWPVEGQTGVFANPQGVNWGGEFLRNIAGYPDPDTGDWLGGIRPVTVETATVYFTEDVDYAFRGLDLEWYGPFDTADAARIPADDAELLISKGLASYSPPGLAGIPGIAEDVSDLKTSADDLSSDIETLQTTVTDLTAQLGTLTMGIGALGVGVVVLALALVLMIRRV